MSNPIFRKESLDKVSSPEQLNDYIKVSNMKVWIIIAGAIILLVSGLVWAAAASIETTLSVNGVANNGAAVCYTADISEIAVGAQVNLPGGKTGTVKSVSAKPLSQNEIKNEKGYDDYTMYSLKLSDWNYVVEISTDGIADGNIVAEIVTNSVSPIAFIWN